MVFTMKLLTMHHEIEEGRGKIAEICQRYRVSRLDVFGSAARGTDFDPETSDADFLVEFEPPILPGIAKRRMGMINDLRTVLGREVDLLRIGTAKNKYLQQAIDESRELVNES